MRGPVAWDGRASLEALAALGPGTWPESEVTGGGGDPSAKGDASEALWLGLVAILLCRSAISAATAPSSTARRNSPIRSTLWSLTCNRRHQFAIACS